MTEWQPIETASKDVTWIMLWRGVCIFARWYDWVANGRVESGWSDNLVGKITDKFVTHWMPLPEPPK